MPDIIAPVFWWEAVPAVGSVNRITVTERIKAKFLV